MNCSRSLTGVALSLLGLLPNLHAQSLIAYPGLNNVSSLNVDIYSTVTFTEQSIFDPGVFKVITTANGSEHYLISNNYAPITELTYDPVVVLNRYFTAPSGIISYTGIAGPITAAILTPDESRFLVAETTFHSYDTSAFRDQTGGVGLTIPGATTVVDLAAGYDSLTAYALGIDGTNSYLSSISLPAVGTGGAPTITNTVPIAGLATNLTIGQDGLLYVSLPGEILQINPETLAPTPTGAIAVSENPGTPVFTPDGNYMVAANTVSTPPLDNAGCEYFVSPPTIVVGNAAQTVNVNVTVSPNAPSCPWSATPPNFATISTPNGTLSGSTSLTFPANTGTTNLTGTLSIAGFDIPVTQLATTTPAAPSEAVLVNLNTNTLAGSIPTISDSAGSYPISELAVENDQLIYAYVNGNATLYTLQIGLNGGLILTAPNLPLIAGSPINGMIYAFGVSNDPGIVPAAGASSRNAPQYIFVITSAPNPALSANGIYSIDPVALTTSIGANEYDPNLVIAYAYPGCSVSNANGGCSSVVPASQLGYGFGAVPGNTQTVALGATSTPMVIRALDPNGYPLSGLMVDWTLTPPNGQATTTTVLNAPETLTGDEGYAEATVTGGTLPTDVGAVQVQASAGGSTPVTFNFSVGAIAPPAPAATLSIVSGQGQLLFIDPLDVNLPPTAPPCVFPTCPDTAADLVVQATDSNGNPVSGAVVTFTDVSSTVPTQVTATTNSVGQASVYIPAPAFTLSYPSYTTEEITACTGTCPGPLSVNFYLTTVTKTATTCSTPPCNQLALPITTSVLSPPPGTVLTGAPGATISNAVQVLVASATGDPIPNVGVSVNTGTNLALPNSSCADPQGSGVALTNSSGIATCSLVLNQVGGSEPLLVSVPAVSASTTPLGSISTGSTLTILQNQPATIAIVSGNDQAGPSGNGAAPFTVQVNDANGQPLPNVTVTFAVTSGSLTFTNGTAVTNAAVPTVTIVTDVNGQAALTATFGTTLGPGTLTATVGTLAPVTFNFATGTLSTNISISSGNNQSAPPNAAFASPLTVQITQANGSPAPYANITWSLLSGVSLVLGTTTGAADSSGMASITVTAGPVPGVAQILATTGAAGAPADVMFTLTVTGATGGPSNVVIMNAADYSTSIGIGSLVSIFGSNITNPITGVDTNPTDLANFTLTFNGVAAPILALVNQNGVQQINAEVPFEITSGTNPVVLQTPQGQVSLPNQTVNNDAPGIFTNGSIAVNGTNYPLVSATRQDGSYVSSSNPALPGDTITFYATGLGQTIPTAFTGQVGVPGELLAEPLYAAINNQGVQVVSAEYTPGMFGLYTIVIQVPQNVVPGAADPLTIFTTDTTGVGYTSPAVYLPVQ